MLPRFYLACALSFGPSVAFAQSTAAASTAIFTSGVWSGNVTPTSVSVVTRLVTAGQKVRLQVSTSATLTPAIFSSAATTAASAGNTLTLSVQGLQPDTDYYYGIEVAGVLRTEAISRGQFHTFPLGRASFRIAFASCSDYNAPDQRAFDAIAAEKPLLFIHMGDLHYHDTNSTNVDDYRANYDAVLNQPNQSALYRSVPLAYMWDDHDFCGNDSDTTFIGRDTARAVYKERAPHYPIASNAGGTIAQSFTVGRVRVIMTDLRSAADPPTKKDNSAKSHLGTAQKAWFKQELINARDAGFPVVLWVSTNPWIGQLDPTEDIDNWTSYQTERTEIANFIRDNRITNVAILAGDMHALAYDDGTHSDYATGGGAPLSVLQAASLTQGGSIKGGPYSGAPLPGSPQYGILEVYDSGGPSIACRFLGMRAGDGRKMSYTFSTFNVASPQAQAFSNISTLARLATGDDSLVSGFVIPGSASRTILVRAVGPTLAQFGVADALAAPQLIVFQNGKPIVTNQAWASAPVPVNADAGNLSDPEAGDAINRLNAAFDSVGAFRLTDPTSLDAAALLTLAPGSYTIQVKSATGTAGSTLLEVYNVPQ
jgi:alkaline phosphatase D